MHKQKACVYNKNIDPCHLIVFHNKHKKTWKPVHPHSENSLKNLLNNMDDFMRLTTNSGKEALIQDKLVFYWKSNTNFLTNALYSVQKNLYNLLGGWCDFLSALHNHCRAEMLKGIMTSLPIRSTFFTKLNFKSCFKGWVHNIWKILIMHKRIKNTICFLPSHLYELTVHSALPPMQN